LIICIALKDDDWQKTHGCKTNTFMTCHPAQNLKVWENNLKKNSLIVVRLVKTLIIIVILGPWNE